MDGRCGEVMGLCSDFGVLRATCLNTIRQQPQRLSDTESRLMIIVRISDYKCFDTLRGNVLEINQSDTEEHLTLRYIA